MRALICAVTCSAAQITAAAEAVPWERVTAAAAWQPRDSASEVVFQNQMWILGGWQSSFAAPPRDVWKSRDGRSWELVTKDAPWRHSDFAMGVAFQDRIWMMGGWYNGRLEGATAGNQVWSSANGEQWELVSAAAAWTPRMAAGIVTFRNRLWILGGTEQYYFGNGASFKNDVWRSADGRNWTQELAHAPWSPRAFHQAVVFDDKIWVLGGGRYLPEYSATNDVWCSADGRQWTCVTEHAPWEPRLWFSAFVYRSRLWILGGWSKNPSTHAAAPHETWPQSDGVTTMANWGDLWSSADGKNWSQLATANSWKPRHEASVFVFHDAIFVAGGHARPLSNEVWRLQLPAGWAP